MAEKLDVEPIEECIEMIIDKFQDCPRFFFTEFDLQSYLYHLLISKDIFKKEYITETGYPIGIVHIEYPATGGKFDLVVLDPQKVGKLPISKQNILCGIEIGLNQNFEHFERDYTKFVPETENKVSFGYVLHFVKGFNVHWEDIVRAVNEEIQNNICSLIKIVDTAEAKALAVRIDVMR